MGGERGGVIKYSFPKDDGDDKAWGRRAESCGVDGSLLTTALLNSGASDILGCSARLIVTTALCTP